MLPDYLEKNCETLGQLMNLIHCELLKIVIQTYNSIASIKYSVLPDYVKKIGKEKRIF